MRVLGDVLVLVSSALYAAYTVLLRKALPGEESAQQVRLAREMGINLLRCHIKVPDPAYLDAADEAHLDQGVFDDGADVEPVLLRNVFVGDAKGALGGL